MAEIGFFLSSEEHGPGALVEFAQRGEEAGFTSVLISDHYHPWLDEQGASPFVWGVIGAIAASTRLKVTTGVTCPTVRIHPAVLAQATATASLLLGGRFCFGVGSGEALNEHILGQYWPPVDDRLDMLEEAVEVIRELWKGELTSHRGRYYRVDNARLYTAPNEAPPIYVSAFGGKALELAARIADGFVTVEPDGEAVKAYKQKGGRGPTLGALKCCYGPDEQESARLAHRLWRSEALGGQLNQELALPSYFAAASEFVTVESVAESIPCGPDPEKHAQAIRAYLEAGFDEVYINQIGKNQVEFLEFFNKEIRHRL